MAVNSGQSFIGDSGQSSTTAIDTILTQEANRIGQDIYRRTLHVSPWMDLIKQTAFPDGMGYTLGTLIYDRALPTQTANGTDLGLSWTEIGGAEAAAGVIGASSLSQLIGGAKDTNIGSGSGRSLIGFSRQLKQYSLKRAIIESPRINVEDLRFAAYRQEQLRAVMDALTDSTRYSWEERYRDEYDKMCANIVPCLTTGTVSYNSINAAGATAATATSVSKEGINLSTSAAAYNSGAPVVVAGQGLVITKINGTVDATPTANISNKVCDSIYYKLVRAGAGSNAYGRENGRPVFTLVISSEASYALQTEAGFRDDVRYNNSVVSELIAPLGVEKSFRGFYHLVDDLAPRFEIGTATSGTDFLAGTLKRILPYTFSGAALVPNPSYDTATYEAAYVIHPDVMESQIPEPISGASGLTFDPVNYRGKFSWKNIPSVDVNPDGTIGFFRGVLASASKPIKTEFGYVILFKRTTSIPAA